MNCMLFVFYCHLLFYTVHSLEGDSCVTPDGKYGTCILLDKCPPLLSILKGPRPLDPHSADFLRSSQCGSVGKTPLVCCNKQTPITTTLTDTNPLTDSVGDVSANDKLKLLPLDSCSQVPEDRIIHGPRAQLFDNPWLALLVYNRLGKEDKIQCGGTIINKRYILTAAHCITNLSSSLKLIGVRLGEHDLSKETDCDELFHGEYLCAPPYQNFAIEKIIPHPQFSGRKLQNDIGLVRLAQDIDFSSEHIRPICLPVGQPQRDTLEGRKVTITGWEPTKTGNDSNVPLRITEFVMPLDQCAAIYSNYSLSIVDTQICAGGEPRASCRVYSGGPLTHYSEVDGEIRRTQYGVVSFGPRICGSNGQPAVYTRVGVFMDWILDNMEP